MAASRNSYFHFSIERKGFQIFVGTDLVIKESSGRSAAFVLLEDRGVGWLAKVLREAACLEG